MLTFLLNSDMFGVFQVNGLVPGVRSVWNGWTDKILEKQDQFGFRKAAMITVNGGVLAHTGSFIPSSQEMKVRNLHHQSVTIVEC